MRRRPRSLAAVFTAVVAGILLASCGAENTSGAPAETASETSAATESTTAPSADSPAASPPTSTGTQPPSDTSVAEVAVPEILQFTAPLVGGGTFDAAAVAGTPTVFWFWAPG